MVNIGKGIIAGFVASAALSGAVVLAAWTGLTLAFHPVEAVSGIMLTPAGLSWVVHFAIGTFLWGGLFSALSPILPGPFWLKGVVFGAIAWLLMAVVIWAADPTSPPQILPGRVLLHLLFGILLGSIYGTLLDRAERRSPTLQTVRSRW
jgi:hypothetical protein